MAMCSPWEMLGGGGGYSLIFWNVMAWQFSFGLFCFILVLECISPPHLFITVLKRWNQMESKPLFKRTLSVLEPLVYGMFIMLSLGRQPFLKSEENAKFFAFLWPLFFLQTCLSEGFFHRVYNKVIFVDVLFLLTLSMFQFCQQS